MAETPVSVNEVKVEAAPTPPPEKPTLTKFRAVVSGGKRGNSNAVFTTADLRALVEGAAAFSDVVDFKVSEGGIEVKVLDNARIALLESKLPKNIFAEFFADGEGDIAVDAKSLLAVLRRAKNEKVELKLEDGVLTITIAGVRSIRVRTLDNSAAEEAPQPKVNHTASAVIDADLFKEALVDARMIKADAVRLVALNGILTFKAVNETKEAEVRLAPAEGSASSTYALDYLVKAAKAFDGVVDVKFGTNSTLELANSYARVFIAPRVE